MFTSTTGRLTSAAVATVAGLAVLAPAAQAVEQGPAEPMAPRLTVAGYTKYLKAQSTPEARKALKRFLALTRGQQTVFVKDLQDRRIHKALLGKVAAPIGKPVSITDPYNKEVRFVTQATSKVGKDKDRTTTVSFTVTQEIFRIPVTSETLTISYPTAGQGPKKVTGKAKVTNVNAAIAIKDNPRVVVNGSEAQTLWVAIPQVKSFGKPVHKKQHIQRTAPGFRAQLTDLG
ncbi:hypothetical protein [Streptomyces neyagawaensis]|uniref:hypothetical protein n=1 Tax=Streptomyces neyagawaensis TaxID=42238 RepID=UPI0006E3E739|nr:hypothetical protein [Streptomyces neyagawaensis]MCL6736380.1 hypothetical protein [Streptomyces neyagawaensis]MDE1685998.1 hypothetical protein [Streptomyces neyagawaensis]